MGYLPVDIIVDQKAKQRHLIDTLNLLAYVVLLVLVLVTTWFFKRRKRLYIHETGLAIIYGLIMGAILRYGGLEINITSDELDDFIPSTVPVDYVIIKTKVLSDKANRTHLYAYEFRGELQPSAKLGSQISYASVNPEVFFNIILPPIVLNAGLSLKRRHFFRNIGAIFSYAFLGTTVSVAFVGSFIYGSIHVIKNFLGSSYLADQFSLANCLYFGAIISPTDPLAVLAIFQELGVDVNLFALVFGESILNDAVSIVLTHSIDHFTLIYQRDPSYPMSLILWQSVTSFINMFLTSCLIGIVHGIVTSLTTKFSKLTDSPLLETSLIVLMSYSSFLTAEVANASGIVAILLCGITQAHYTINNLSFEARERIKNLFELLTFLCENFLFLAVGVAFWQRDQNWDFTFIGLAFIAVIIARALSVYPLTQLLNLGRRNKIPCNFQHLIAWGGAARGVISYSLAAKNTVGDARRIMLSTTSVIVIFSVIVVGGVVDPMLKCLKIPCKGGGNGDGGQEEDEEEEYMKEHGIDSRQLIMGNNPNWLVRRKRIRRSSSEASLTGGGGVQAAQGHQSGSQTPNMIGSKWRHHHHQHSTTTTPILEVEAVWSTAQQQQLKCRHHQQYQGVNFDLLTSQSGSVGGNFHNEQLPIVPESSNERPNTSTSEQTENLVSADKCQQCLWQQQQQQQQQPPALVINSPGGSSTLVSQQEPTAEDRQQIERPYENASLVRRWRNLDNNFIKPLLTNSHPTLLETMPPALSGLARLFTSGEQMMRHQAFRN